MAGTRPGAHLLLGVQEGVDDPLRFAHEVWEDAFPELLRTAAAGTTAV
ncbi:hypothetical protein AB0G87_38360 [Streptomyces asoensis]